MSTSNTFAGETAAPAAPQIHVETVQLALLAPDENQIRKHFDDESLQSLADSIRQNGLIQPIVARPRITLTKDNAGTADYDYKIIAGERRYRAAKLAGIEHVPVIVRQDLDHADIAVIQVLENLQREDLTLAETCAGVAKLVESIGFAKTCEQLGKSEAWVSKHAGVVKLPDVVRQLVGDGKVDSVDVAKDIAALIHLAPQKAEQLIQRLDPKARLHQQAPLEAPAEPREDGDDEDDDDEPKASQRVWCGTGYKTLAEMTELEREQHELREQRRTEGTPLTRREVRLELLEVKAQIEQKQAVKLQRQAERAAASTDPEVAKKLAAEKTKAEREAANKRAIKSLNEQASALADELTGSLAERLGLPKPKKTTYGFSHDIPVRVWPPNLSPHSTQRPPSSPAVVEYRIDIEGTFDQVKSAAKLLDVQPKFSFDVRGDITLIEAKKLADVLGSRVTFQFEARRKGGELQLIASGHRQPAKPTAAPAKGKSAPKANKASGKKPPPRESQIDLADPIHQFLGECVARATPAHRVLASDVHSAYVAWCARQTPELLDPPSLNSNAWGQSIAEYGIEKIRSNGIRYVGIKLKGGEA